MRSNARRTSSASRRTTRSRRISASVRHQFDETSSIGRTSTTSTRVPIVVAERLTGSGQNRLYRRHRRQALPPLAERQSHDEAATRTVRFRARFRRLSERTLDSDGNRFSRRNATFQPVVQPRDARGRDRGGNERRLVLLANVFGSRSSTSTRRPAAQRTTRSDVMWAPRAYVRPEAELRDRRHQPRYRGGFGVGGVTGYSDTNSTDLKSMYAWVQTFVRQASPRRLEPGMTDRRTPRRHRHASRT